MSRYLDSIVGGGGSESRLFGRVALCHTVPMTYILWSFELFIHPTKPLHF